MPSVSTAISVVSTLSEQAHAVLDDVPIPPANFSRDLDGGNAFQTLFFREVDGGNAFTSSFVYDYDNSDSLLS